MEKSNNNLKYFAGIGSRETPINLQEDIDFIVNYLNKKGYILRSGGAVGADSMFEKNCDINMKEIFIPWKNYNNSSSLLYFTNAESMVLAEKYHPAWNRLTQPVKKLMARNCCQILGEDLKTPVDFVICYTIDGKATGGTGQAMRLAKDYDIPIFNLYDRDKCFKELNNFLNPISLF